MSNPTELVIVPRFEPDTSAQVELLRGLLVRLRDSETVEEAFDAPLQHDEGLTLVEAPNESTPA